MKLQGAARFILSFQLLVLPRLYQCMGAAEIDYTFSHQRERPSRGVTRPSMQETEPRVERAKKTTLKMIGEDVSVGDLPAAAISPSLAQMRTATSNFDTGTTQSTVDMPLPEISFDGLSAIRNYHEADRFPSVPDTNGAVGRDHYVQVTNIMGEIFDKNSGESIEDFELVDLWENYAQQPECADNEEEPTDPIVLYDQFEDRWFVMLITLGCLSNSGHSCFLCIAVSRNSDPTDIANGYHHFSFESNPTDAQGNPIPGRFVMDYPKAGVWSDSYFVTTRDQNVNGDRYGVSAWAFKKSAMLSGQAPQYHQIFKDGDGIDKPYIGLATQMLPPNASGLNPPPIGAPALFFSHQDDNHDLTDGQTQQNIDALHPWMMSADWLTNQVSFTKLSGLPTEPFDSFICHGQDFGEPCISQPGTSERLDSISEWLMQPLVYRNWDCFESYLINHSVKAQQNGVAGIAWYEVRRDGNDVWIHQQGIFSPNDQVSRWIGSIGQDGCGNIALGYSVSGDHTFPGIRYTGRLREDALGKMTMGEVVMQESSGVQMSSGSRWGDYSSMVVDPVDDNTFWYTNEYYTRAAMDLGYIFDEKEQCEDPDATPGEYQHAWNTRISRFKIPGCGKTLSKSKKARSMRRDICHDYDSQLQGRRARKGLRERK